MDEPRDGGRKGGNQVGSTGQGTFGGRRRGTLAALVALTSLTACVENPGSGRGGEAPRALPPAAGVLAHAAPARAGAGAPAESGERAVAAEEVGAPAEGTPALVARDPDTPGRVREDAAAEVAAPPAPSTAPEASAAALPAPEPPSFSRPAHVRGIYLNAWAAGSARRSAELVALARRTEVNSFVIDVKDASGYVSHVTAVPLAREVGATGELRIRDLPGLLRRLEEAGIYPIARIVVFKDPLVAEARPDLAIHDSTGASWRDDKGEAWVNPYHREVWDYHVELAREVAAMGFPEIQWDYVRFPDAPKAWLDEARYEGSEGRTRWDAIRGFLSHAREALSPLEVEVTADVFGVTTSASHDVGIGQVWESFIDVVDVALPMVYPSHYWRGSFGIEAPNAHPYEIVREALSRGLARSSRVDGAGTVRPWLQDFTLGQPRYGAPEVRAQIEATYDVGIAEWVLWNPGSRYTEEALAPEGGFPAGTDPLIRLGGRIVPASSRHVPAEPSQPEDTAPPEAPAPQPPPHEHEPGAGPERPPR